MDDANFQDEIFAEAINGIVQTSVANGLLLPMLWLPYMVGQRIKKYDISPLVNLWILSNSMLTQLKRSFVWQKLLKVI